MSASTPPPKRKRGMGCCGCGALILFLLAMLLLVMTGGTAWWAHTAFLNVTATQPMPVPSFEKIEATYPQAEQKIEAFRQEYNAEPEPSPSPLPAPQTTPNSTPTNTPVVTPRPAPPASRVISMRLTGDEINAIVIHEYPKLKDHFYVSMEGDKGRMQYSLHMSEFDPRLPDRYLNGDSTLRLAFDKRTGDVNVTLDQLKFNGVEVPLNGVNDSSNAMILQLFNQALKKNPVVNDFLSRTQKLQIENGALVIETRPP